MLRKVFWCAQGHRTPKTGKRLWRESNFQELRHSKQYTKSATIEYHLDVILEPWTWRSPVFGVLLGVRRQPQFNRFEEAMATKPGGGGGRTGISRSPGRGKMRGKENTVHPTCLLIRKGRQISDSKGHHSVPAGITKAFLFELISLLAANSTFNSHVVASGLRSCPGGCSKRATLL